MKACTQSDVLEEAASSGGASAARARRLRRPGLAAALILCVSWALSPAPAGGEEQDQTRFKRIPTQFIAALGDPQASSGSGAEAWGLWREDPGPRGVWLGSFRQLKAADGKAPAGWRYDRSDWWLDENGLIMEKPDFPVPPGKYVVTGDRETVAVLTIHPADADGVRRWELDNGAQLYDVTHLPCRSARYTPATDDESCTPANASMSMFPVDPGGAMPALDGCNKRQYSVLFVVGVPADA